MKVKIIKADNTNWYSEQIGSILCVEEGAGYYNLLGCNRTILKSDCEIISETETPTKPKSIEDFYINFDELKVGDKVWHVTAGWLNIEEFENSDNTDYPIIIGSSSFTAKGYKYKSDDYPTIYKSNPFGHIQQVETFKPRMMWVSDESVEDAKENKLAKFVTCIDPLGMCIAYEDVYRIEDLDKDTSYTIWEYAVDIEEQLTDEAPEFKATDHLFTIDQTAHINKMIYEVCESKFKEAFDDFINKHYQKKV